ncbi:MAG TPA: hypothetical protein VH395_09655 [Jatrophihabitantaceae bacterium]
MSTNAARLLIGWFTVLVFFAPAGIFVRGTALGQFARRPLGPFVQTAARRGVVTARLPLGARLGEAVPDGLVLGLGLGVGLGEAAVALAVLPTSATTASAAIVTIARPT